MRVRNSTGAIALVAAFMMTIGSAVALDLTLFGPMPSSGAGGGT
jgi:hypothetical protein